LLLKVKNNVAGLLNWVWPLKVRVSLAFSVYVVFLSISMF